MTCNRVIIIHHGKILASDTPENLMRKLHSGGVIEAEVRGPLAAVEAKLRTVAGVAGVTATADDEGIVTAILEPQPGVDPREAIFKAVAESGWGLRELCRNRTTLEDIFVQITHDEDEAEEDRRESRGSVLR
jgi:ABC-2 type transport system ATP-binding protein